MKAEIISIGTEITTGQNLDTNSQWLSRQLAAVGIPVGFHTTVADDFDDNVAVIGTAARRAGLVIITGGLGPTLDDLTREALAKVAGVELTFNQTQFDAIAGMFAKRNRPMPERNRVQAMFPAGSEPIANDLGTAPGIWMRIGETIIVALPGVPFEMKAMYAEVVLPRLKALGLGFGVIIERRMNCFGTGESHVEEMLKDVTARGQDPEVGITASDAVISLRIVAKAANEAEARAKVAPVEAIIRHRLGPLVYGVDAEELQDVVARMLGERKLTVAVAESITAGQVAERLARVPGISAWLKGGVVSYVNEIKASVLGIPLDLIREHGAVSAPVAEAMATNVRRLFGSEIAVSTTGLAGPGDGGEAKPVGRAYVGMAWDGGAQVREVNWFGNRVEIQSRTARSALNELRLWMLHSFDAAKPNH
jgi:nicotinamide-nucleotide amidase